MSKVKWKGGTLLAPVPAVLVSCGTLEKPNALTVAWTGITGSNPPRMYISLRPERYSHGIIKESGEFAVNLAPSQLVRAVDYCGVKSGRDEDKLKKCSLTPEPLPDISCPGIAQSPLTLECKVTEILPQGSHDMFIADIVGVCVDGSLIDEEGRLHLSRAGLLAYCHGEYYALGKRIGKFGFSVRKKRKK